MTEDAHTIDAHTIDAHIYSLRTEILAKDTAMDALVAEVDRLRRLIGTMESAMMANEKKAPVVSERKKLALERWAYYHERKDVVAAALGGGQQHWRTIKRATDKEWRELQGGACPTEKTEDADVTDVAEDADVMAVKALTAAN
jgi:hypothetical protein